jgi:hypothetical protein
LNREGNLKEKWLIWFDSWKADGSGRNQEFLKFLIGGGKEGNQIYVMDYSCYDKRHLIAERPYSE